VSTIAVYEAHDRAKVRALQEALTALLPDWFARPDANQHYAAQAKILPAWIATLDGADRGLLLLKRHGFLSAEIYWMAVHPDYHRHGIGRALLDNVAAAMAREDRRFLFVCTLGEANPDTHYARTRRFYESQGFVLGLTEHGSGPDGMVYYVKLLQ
jgi:GNAT superfamily N-acetyltransferase